MDFLHCAAHHFVTWNIFVRGEDVLGTVVAVNVRGNEVHRHVFLFAVLNEGVSPGGLRRRRASYAKPRIDSFDGASCMVIKFPVSGLLWIPGPEINIGLVPNFE